MGRQKKKRNDHGQQSSKQTTKQAPFQQQTQNTKQSPRPIMVKR